MNVLAGEVAFRFLTDRYDREACVELQQEQ